jgi:surfactin synthase thioesterase subunit
VSHRYPGGHFYLKERLAEVIADLVADLRASHPMVTSLPQ